MYASISDYHTHTWPVKNYWKIRFHETAGQRRGGTTPRHLSDPDREHEVRHCMCCYLIADAYYFIAMGESATPIS
jgi:hypothetical protein